MSFEVTKLLNRLGLSHHQQRLADNGFDSLECLYGITEHDLEALGIERGDRRTLQQELRGREAQDGSEDQAASPTNSLWYGSSGEASTVASSHESAGALNHPELESASRSRLFQRQRNMHSYLVKGLHSDNWGYLILSNN
jgi:hypothetical protein